MALTTEQVQNAYVAFFNRPADVEGLAYWKSYPGATADLFNTFAQSKEYNSLYANMNNTQVVNAVYQNLFGRSPDVAGLNYWVSQLSSGALKIGTIADAVNRGAQSTDAQIIGNKVTAATTFTQSLDTTAKIVAYAGVNSTGLTAVKSWLATVGSDATSLANAVSSAGLTSITNIVLANVASTGTVSVLTASSDNVMGTSGDDSIAGVNNATAGAQFTATDTVDGGAGLDTLKLELNASYGGGATVRNIEQISITSTVTDAVGATGGTFNLAGVSGLTLIENNSSSNNTAGGNDVQTFANVSSAANVSVKNTTGDTTVIYTDNALAGTADAVKLTLDNVGQGQASAINLNNTSVTSGATGIETLTVDLAGAVGVATQAVTLGSNAQSVSKLVLTGSGSANLALGGALATTAVVIDASATTGGVMLSGFGVANHAVTLGAGNDSVSFGGNLTATDTLKGGAGQDVIATTASNWGAMSTLGVALSAVSEFETLQVVDDATSSVVVDAGLVGVSHARLAGQTGAELVTVNNLGGTAHLANVRFDAGVTGVTLNLRDATLPSTADVVNLDVRGVAQTYAFTLNGVETLNVDASNAGTSVALTLTDPALTGLKVANTGLASFDAGVLGANVGVVDFSGMTGGGSTSVVLNTAATVGANITGTAGADAVTGSSLLDVINTGNGNDTVTASAGGDRINMGTGTDRFNANDVNGATNALAPVVTGGTSIDAASFHLIAGMGAGDSVRLDNTSNVTGYDTVGALANSQAITAVAFHTTFADNQVNMIRGSFNSTTGAFTISATGADSVLVYDANATSGATDFQGIVLVGYATSATALNLTAASNQVDLILVV